MLDGIGPIAGLAFMFAIAWAVVGIIRMISAGEGDDSGVTVVSASAFMPAGANVRTGKMRAGGLIKEGSEGIRDEIAGGIAIDDHV